MSRNRLMELRVGILCLLMAGSAAAQSDRGTIAGSVLDSTGAAVSGAAVTIKGADHLGTMKGFAFLDAALGFLGALPA